MSVQRASTPRSPFNSRRIVQSLLLAGTVSASALGCSFGWDSLDPRLGGEGGAPGTTTGETGSTSGTGGASSTATTSGVTTTSSTGVASTSTAGTGGDPSTATTGGVGGSTSSSSSSSSSSSGTGGVGPVDCGGTSVLSDDFPGGDPADLWQLNSTNNVVSETGGEAVIVLPNSMNGSWGEFDSNHAYDFRGDSVSIAVTSATNPMTTAQAWFGVGYDSNYLQIYQKHGFIHVEYQLAGTTTLLAKTMYDPVAHHNWRFREDGVNTYWETSSDGASWTMMAKVPTATLFPMDTVWVWFGAGTDGGEVNPGTAQFDHLNGGGAPTQKWCPMSSFTDDFSDGTRPLAWKRGWDDTSTMIAETGGKLSITLVPNSSGSAAYGSSSAFDLTSSSLTLEVPSVVTSADGSETSVDLIAPGDNLIEQSVSQGTLYFSLKLLGIWMEIGSLQYSPVDHRWWRIRESAGTLYWDTSPDGKAWVVRATHASSAIATDALYLYLESGEWSAQPSPGVSSFDNVNLPPP
jgi:hypothetical protein